MATVESYRKPSDPDARKVYYLVRYRTPDNRQTKKRGFTTKRKAEEFASAVESSKMRGEYIDPTHSRVTIGERGPLWLRRQTQHLKASSYRPLEIAWRVHVAPRWAGVRISDVEHSAVQDWVTDLGARKSATTVKRAFGVLSAILEECVRDKRLLSNPCVGIRTKRKVSRQHIYLTHSDVHRLAAEATGHELLVLVLAYTGLRWGELAGLRVSDVDPLRRRLNVNQNAVEVGAEVIVGTPKGHARRSVPYPAMLHPQVLDQCANKLPAALLFPGPDGSYLRRTRTDGSSSGWFAGAVRRSGLPRITPHELRHSAASLAVQAGANVKVIQRMLGHKSAAMTLDTYADLFDDDLDAVAAAMDAAAAPFLT